jgi:PAS domain S-box-containing protein
MSSNSTTESDDRGLPARRLVWLIAPVVGVGVFTTALALAAAAAGFHRDEMLVVAAALGCAAAVPALFVIYRQLTETRVARRQLENIQARVGGILESAMDAVISVDEEQRVVVFNAAAERVFRWPRKAVLGQRLDMLLPERFRKAHGAHIEGFGRGDGQARGMGPRTVLNGLRADGEEFPIEASISRHVEDGRMLFTVILRDVTERVRAEERLARSEMRLRGILDSAMDAIVTVDQSQHIVLFNEAAERVFGCPRHEALGAPLAWFIPERFREGHGVHVQRFGQTGATTRRMGEQRIVTGLRRNGEEFPIEASISQIDEHGQKFFTVILRDVTERHRAERALERSREEVRALAVVASTAREAEMSRISRELHDELGQALTSLKMDLTWLRTHAGEVSAPARVKLAAMQVLLDGTVAAARRISGNLRPLMLDDLGLPAAVEWQVQNFMARTGIPTELVMGHDLDLEDPHATTVFRVLQESLTNIAKHAQASSVEVSLSREGDVATLLVRDDGRGFDLADKPRANAFGLIGMRERVGLLNGELRVESAADRGTTIEMHLPVDGRKEAA